MSVINNLNKTTSEELGQLLEVNGIIIKKKTGAYFNIECPTCKKPEAFIYFNGGTRTIKCNRKNNCGEEIELWQYIANKQGLDAHNNFGMLKYINEFLGYDFIEQNSGQYNTEQAKKEKEQNFLIHCHQIFINALRNKNNEQVTSSLMYLQERQYNEEYIKQFRLGFFPNYKDLLHLLITEYSYSSDDAENLTQRYFKGIIKVNNYQSNNEEYKNRIVFTWYDHKGNRAGFSVRKPTNQNSKHKYINSNELRRGELLFNLDRIKQKKELVIVEGLFDALTPTYYASDEVKQKYDFVATGQNSITDNQIGLIKNKGYSQVIIILDQDNAGKAFFKSTSKLREHGITPFIALIPNEYEVKDVDELIRKHPDASLQVILDNAKYAVEAEIEYIIQNSNGAKTDINRDKAIRECLRLKISSLESEYEPYRKVMYEKFDIHIDNREEVKKLEEKLSTTLSNSSNSKIIKSEVEKLKLDVQQKIIEIEDNIKDGKADSIDIHDFKKRIYEIQKLILKNDISIDRNHKEPNLKALANMLANIEEYNVLLKVNYDIDRPYTQVQLLERVIKGPQGIATGFKQLDKYVTIQPSSLVFIAGKPSHGKTTMMLNICRNMIKANPDKAFLFYSYEEEVQQIWLKIILTNIELRDNSKEKEEGGGYLEKIINQMKMLKISSVDSKDNGNIDIFNNNLKEAYDEVEKWINEGRLQILDRKPNVEMLSGAIIERAQASAKLGKPVAVVFIDYVQKLNTTENKINRQQELQKICQALLNTAMDKRVNAAIILGAQVNREVTSLSTLDMSKMREAADIEQDANLILGVWDERAAELDRLRNKLADLEEKILSAELGYKDKGVNLNQLKQNIQDKIDEKESSTKETSKQIKILKNRNGKKDNIVKLTCYPERFLIIDKKITSINNSTFDKAISNFITG